MSDSDMWADDDDNDPDYVPPGEMENGHITSHDEESESGKTKMRSNHYIFKIGLSMIL